MTRQELLEFIRSHALAVQASVSASGAPQAAVVGIVVSDTFEVFFDTLASSRKCQNLRRDPRIALVIGGTLQEECTVQLEGSVDEPGAGELERLQKLYFARFPDGVLRQSWPGITYFRVKPTWVRFSDFRGDEPELFEFDASSLAEP